GNVLGTVDYVAPELFEVHRRADARTDLYSMGVLLHEMPTGRLTFTADNQLALISMHASKQAPSPRLYVPQITTAVENVMFRALEKHPEMRYDSATALAEAFCQVVNQGKSGTGLAHGEREPATVAMGPLAAAPSSSSPQVRPSPLAGATEGFVLPPVPPPGSGARFETPPPMRLSESEPHPRSRRALFLTLLALAALLLISVPVGYAVFNHQAPGTPTPSAQITGTVGAQS